MKKIISVVLCISILSCTKEENTTITQSSNTTTDLSISFNNTVSGVAINSDSTYTNAAGNKYQVSILKYYVTNLVFIDENKNEFFAKNYNLIDFENLNQNTFTVKNIPTKKYVQLKCMIGVDSARNYSGAQDGYLDPSYGMIWTWNTGYIFYKHEGTFTNDSNENQALRFHLGTELARSIATIDLPKIDLNSKANKLTINFDLNKAYGAKNNIDFNVNNDHQSDKPLDRFWISTLIFNLQNSFSFQKFE